MEENISELNSSSLQRESNSNQTDYKPTQSSPVKCFITLLMVAILSTLLSLVVIIYPWLPPIEFGFLSSTTVLFFSVPLWITNTRFNEENRKALSNKKLILIWMLKDTAGTMSSMFHYLSLKTVSPSIVAIISSCNPFLAAIFGRVFLKEPLTSVKLIGLTFTVAGMILTTFVTDPSGVNLTITSKTQVIGSLYAIASAFCSGALFVLWKRLGNINGTSLIITSSINGSVISLVMNLAIEGYVIPPCGSAAWFLTFAGLTNVATGLLLNLACRYGEGGIISALITGLSVIFSFIWQLVFFKHHPGTLECLAGLMVLIGTTFNGFGIFLGRFKLFSFTI